MAKKTYMVDLDINLNALLNAVIDPIALDPEAGQLKEARVWYNTAEKKLKFFDGTVIKTLAIGDDLTTALTRATAAASAGILTMSGGADRSVESYTQEGLVWVGTDGVARAATPSTDYLVPSDITNLKLSVFAASEFATDISSNSNSQIATADVIKSYVDGKVSALGKLLGAFDASSGVLPTVGSGAGGALLAGDYWRTTVAGDVTGIGHLEIGDALVVGADGAIVAADFFSLQANLTDAVTSNGLASTDNAIARYDGTSGRMLQNSGATLSDAGTMNLPAGQTYQVNGIDILAGLNESAVTVDEDGGIDLPPGATYKIDGVNILDTITGMSKKYAASFNGTTDWTGAVAPFSFVVTAATHGLGATGDLVAHIKDATGAEVETDTHVHPTTGTMTVSSNSKFAGRYILLG